MLKKRFKPKTLNSTFVYVGYRPGEPIVRIRTKNSFYFHSFRIHALFLCFMGLNGDHVMTSTKKIQIVTSRKR